MSGILSLLTLFGLPLLLSILLALAQLAFYRMQVARGKLARERVPFFPFLILRGLVVVVAVGAAVAIAAFLLGPSSAH